MILRGMMLAFAVMFAMVGLLVVLTHRYRDTPDNDAPYEPHRMSRKVLYRYLWLIIPVLALGVLSTFS